MYLQPSPTVCLKEDDEISKSFVEGKKYTFFPPLVMG